MLYNRESIEYAVKVIKTPQDGSSANKHARQVAKKHLLGVSQDLTEFANIKPSSAPARYLFEYCAHLRSIAAQVELPDPDQQITSVERNQDGISKVLDLKNRMFDLGEK